MDGGISFNYVVNLTQLVDGEVLFACCEYEQGKSTCNEHPSVRILHRDFGFGRITIAIV
jgi:hypothetical protein